MSPKTPTGYAIVVPSELRIVILTLTLHVIDPWF